GVRGIGCAYSYPVTGTGPGSARDWGDDPRQRCVADIAWPAPSRPCSGHRGTVAYCQMSEPKPLLEVAIEGDGLSPSDVPVRQLVELLEATVSAIDAVAAERGLDPPELRLVSVHE